MWRRGTRRTSAYGFSSTAPAGDSTISRGRARFVELFAHARLRILARELRALAIHRGNGRVAAPPLPRPSGRSAHAAIVAGPGATAAWTCAGGRSIAEAAQPSNGKIERRLVGASSMGVLHADGAHRAATVSDAGRWPRADGPLHGHARNGGPIPILRPKAGRILHLPAGRSEARRRLFAHRGPACHGRDRARRRPLARGERSPRVARRIRAAAKSRRSRRPLHERSRRSRPPMSISTCSVPRTEHCAQAGRSISVWWFVSGARPSWRAGCVADAAG